MYYGEQNWHAMRQVQIVGLITATIFAAFTMTLIALARPYIVAIYTTDISQTLHLIVWSRLLRLWSDELIRVALALQKSLYSFFLLLIIASLFILTEKEVNEKSFSQSPLPKKKLLGKSVHFPLLSLVQYKHQLAFSPTLLSITDRVLPKRLVFCYNYTESILIY